MASSSAERAAVAAAPSAERVARKEGEGSTGTEGQQEGHVCAGGQGGERVGVGVGVRVGGEDQLGRYQNLPQPEGRDGLYALPHVTIPLGVRYRWEGLGGSGACPRQHRRGVFSG